MKLALALAAGLLWAAPPAFAYKRSTAGVGGPCLFWNSRGHSYQIDALGTPGVPGSDAFDAVRSSFASWAAISCSDLAFPDLGLSTDPKDRRIGYVPGGVNRNLVFWRTADCSGTAPPNDPCLTAGSCGNTYDCWGHGDNVIAVTTTTFNRLTGEIYDADIELNDAPHQDGTRFQFTTVDGPLCSSSNQTGCAPVCTTLGEANCIAYDVQNTVTHEAGHSIGLDHSLDPTATMYAFAPEGDVTKRTLHADDVQAICDIYPQGRPTVTCLGAPITLTPGPSSNGGGSGCSAIGRSGSAEWIVALFAAIGWRRQRRRDIGGA